MRMSPQPPLFHPFDTDALEGPRASDRGLLLGATADIAQATPFDAQFTFIQGFRPEFLRLSAAGFNAVPELDAGNYGTALILASRHRGENEMRLAQAILHTSNGGLVVFAGGKTDGVSSFRKRLAETVPLEGHLAKNHGEVFWINAGAIAQEWASAVLAQPEPLVEGRFRTAPGMFSHDRVDVGSRLLADCLPANLAGTAADFCAGWGYLSVILAERCPAIASIDLFEADHASLKSAEANMAALAPHKFAGFHWVDLATEPVERRFDVVVMNPPFHQGRAADPGIGQTMIRAASKALKPGGQLFMVANRGLPYGPPLQSGFARVEEIADAQGFKVWRARR